MKRNKRLFKKVMTFTIPAVMAAQMAVAVPAVVPVNTFAAVAEVGFDNSVLNLPDGTYSYPADENTYVSGGGRHAPDINVKSVTVSGGRATAVISLSSGTYEYVTVSDDLDDLVDNNKKDVDAAGNKIAASHPDADHSEFTIPVKLNEDMRFCGWSSSVDSWISPYVINISLNVATAEKIVKRSIKFVDESGAEVAQHIEQNVWFTKAAVTGGKSAITQESNWESDNNQFAAVNVPDITDMTPDIKTVAAETADPAVPEKEVTVVYKKNDIPQNPETNTDEESGNTDSGAEENNNNGSSDETENNNSAQNTDPDGDPDKNIDNGSYEVEYQDAPSKRFNVTKVVLNSDNGEYTADITLGGTGYGYVYPGSSAEAETAGEENWAPFTEEEDGTYTYRIKVPVLNKLFTLASRSIRDGVWYDEDRGIIIFSKDTEGNELPTHSTADVSQTETKVLVRTVRFEDENGERLAADVVQSVTFTREKLTSGVDGSVRYTTWTPESYELPSVAAAEVPGMKADEEFLTGYFFNPEVDNESVTQVVKYTIAEAGDNNTEGNTGSTDAQGNSESNDDGSAAKGETGAETGEKNEKVSAAGDTSGAAAASAGRISTTAPSSTGSLSSADSTGVALAAGTTGTTSSNAPATGDKNPAGGWIGAGAVAVGGIFAAVFALKSARKRQRR